MTEAVLFFAVTVFAVIGIATSMQYLADKMLNTEKNQYILSLLPCKGHREDLEYLVKSSYFRLKQHDACKGCRILVIDRGMDDETRNICKMLCKKFDFVSLCEDAETVRLLEEKFCLQIL